MKAGISSYLQAIALHIDVHLETEWQTLLHCFLQCGDFLTNILVPGQQEWRSKLRFYSTQTNKSLFRQILNENVKKILSFAPAFCGVLQQRPVVANFDTFSRSLPLCRPLFCPLYRHAKSLAHHQGSTPDQIQQHLPHSSWPVTESLFQLCETFQKKKSWLKWDSCEVATFHRK